MRLITKDPLPRLKAFVKQMWIIEENGSLNVNVKSFPVGYAFINSIDGDRFKVRRDNHSEEYYSYMAGPNSSHFNLEMDFVNRALTIQLQPYALPSLFGIPASEFYNQVLLLSAFDHRFSQQLEELITSDLTSAEVLDSVCNILMEKLECQTSDARVAAARTLILRNKGKMPISILSDELNLSQRRLQQLFQHYFGMTAKSYARVVKMQHHTFQWLHGESLDTIIPDGYYDQSHFIHELRRQTGMLPGEFFEYINNERAKPAYIHSNLYYQPHLT